MSQAIPRMEPRNGAVGSPVVEGMHMIRMTEPTGRPLPAPRPEVSFEFFPPQSARLERSLWHALERLAPLNPTFVSVTYGAAGSTRRRTHEVVTAIRQKTSLRPAAHLTCVDASREEIASILGRYWDHGIRHIVALRGDAPEGERAFSPNPQGYRYAAELVAGIRTVADFEVSVATHPEGHPETPGLGAEIENLKRKQDAGATRAMTQYFFAPETYLRFRDQAVRAGVRIPIVPGILPVTDFAQLCRISARCGARVPDWLVRLYEGLEDDPETGRLVGAQVSAELCQSLEREGVRAFHFYTLNRPELTRAICRFLGIEEARLPARQPTAPEIHA